MRHQKNLESYQKAMWRPKIFQKVDKNFTANEIAHHLLLKDRPKQKVKITSIFKMTTQPRQTNWAYNLSSRCPDNFLNVFVINLD